MPFGPSVLPFNDSPSLKAFSRSQLSSFWLLLAAPLGTKLLGVAWLPCPLPPFPPLLSWAICFCIAASVLAILAPLSSPLLCPASPPFAVVQSRLPDVMSCIKKCVLLRSASLYAFTKASERLSSRSLSCCMANLRPTHSLENLPNAAPLHRPSGIRRLSARANGQ